MDLLLDEKLVGLIDSISRLDRDGDRGNRLRTLLLGLREQSAIFQVLQHRLSTIILGLASETTKSGISDRNMRQREKLLSLQAGPIQ